MKWFYLVRQLAPFRYLEFSSQFKLFSIRCVYIYISCLPYIHTLMHTPYHTLHYEIVQYFHLSCSLSVYKYDSWLKMSSLLCYSWFFYFYAFFYIFSGFFSLGRFFSLSRSLNFNFSLYFYFYFTLSLFLSLTLTLSGRLSLALVSCSFARYKCPRNEAAHITITYYFMCTNRMQQQ